MRRVHIAGASGYAAAEAVRFLSRHPSVELGALESANAAGESVGDHFPRLRRLERRFDPPGTIEKNIVAEDIVLLAGASGTARSIAPGLLTRRARVIDLSGDFRMLPSQATYGFPERYRAEIASARLVANPGCYPTATLLATLPLAGLSMANVVVDAKSGVTGAGRTPAVTSLYAEVAADVRAYGLGGHRHEAEIVQQWEAAGIGASLVFTPHVVPLIRGMLAGAYCVMQEPVEEIAVRARFERAYAANPFVRLLPARQAPSVAAVAGTNDAEIAVSVHGNVVRVICAIDNLGKGAAGQAVQNLNLMLGLPEETALLDERTHAAAR